MYRVLCTGVLVSVQVGTLVTNSGVLFSVQVGTLVTNSGVLYSVQVYQRRNVLL